MVSSCSLFIKLSSGDKEFDSCSMVDQVTFVCVCVCVCVCAPLYPTLCNPTDCSLPGFSVHGISQARTLEWVVMPSFRGSSLPKDWTHFSCVYCVAGRFFTAESWGKQGHLPIVCDKHSLNLTKRHHIVREIIFKNIWNTWGRWNKN